MSQKEALLHSIYEIIFAFSMYHKDTVIYIWNSTRAAAFFDDLDQILIAVFDIFWKLHYENIQNIFPQTINGVV